MRAGLWEEIRPAVKEAFRRAGIVECELGYKPCAKDNMLTFAHAKKRRNVPDEEGAVVILACIPCHDIIEAMSHARMEGIVMGTIAKRSIQPVIVDSGSGPDLDHEITLDGENAWVVAVRKDGAELTVFCKNVTFPAIIEGDRVLLKRPTGEAIYKVTRTQGAGEPGEVYFEGHLLSITKPKEVTPV